MTNLHGPNLQKGINLLHFNLQRTNLHEQIFNGQITMNTSS